MKKIITLLAAVSMSAAAWAQDIASLEIGSDLPERSLKMKAVQGKEVSIEEVMKKNGVMVMFSCNTCPFVVKSQKRTKEMLEYAEKNNIGVIIINSNEAQRNETDSYDAMKTYAAKQDYKAPYVVDENSKMANLFGATRTPEVFLFNADGILMYHGAMEDNPASPSESKEFYLKDAITKMVNGEKPEPAFTKSIGCTIKRKEGKQ